VSLEGNGVVLSALKPSEDGTGITVRLQNLRSLPVESVLTFALGVKEAWEARLDEVVTGRLVPDGDRVRCTVPARGLWTAKIVFENR
jgi:alpha-mannosidase